jgi:predicted enzyme related to lactoylglutathione lyase
MPMNVIAVSYDCADAAKTAAFWAAALGREVEPGASPASARVAAADVATTGPRLRFHQVPEGKTVKNRLHLDLGTQDAAADTERLVGLGASVLRIFEEDGRHRWTTLADPEGNEFDLVST